MSIFWNLPHMYVCVWIYKFSKDFFFQIFQHNRAQWVNENHWSEISQKTLFWTKWPILARLCPKILQAYVTGSMQSIFFKRWSMIGHNKSGKIIGVKFSQKSSFGPNGELWSKIMQGYITGSTLRIF